MHEFGTDTGAVGVSEDSLDGVQTRRIRRVQRTRIEKLLGADLVECVIRARQLLGQLRLDAPQWVQMGGKMSEKAIRIDVLQNPNLQPLKIQFLDLVTVRAAAPGTETRRSLESREVIGPGGRNCSRFQQVLLVQHLCETHAVRMQVETTQRGEIALFGRRLVHALPCLVLR